MRPIVLSKTCNIVVLLNAAVSNKVTVCLAGCQSSILFMTDGEAPDPTGGVNARNGGPYHSGNAATANGHYTRIFTYAFGAGSNVDSMKSIACSNGGVFHQVSDSDGPRLKEIMANYFVTTFSS